MLKKMISLVLSASLLATTALPAFAVNSPEPPAAVVIQASVSNPKTGERISVPIELNEQSIRTVALDSDIYHVTATAEAKLLDFLPATRAGQSNYELDSTSSVKGTLNITYSYENGDRNYVRLDKVSGSFVSNVSNLSMYDVTVSPGQCGTNVINSDMVGTRVGTSFSLNTGFTKYICKLDPLGIVGAYASTMIHYRNYTDWKLEVECYAFDNWGGGLSDLINGGRG